MFDIKIPSKIIIYSGVSVNVFCDYFNDGDHKHMTTPFKHDFIFSKPIKGKFIWMNAFMYLI